MMNLALYQPPSAPETLLIATPVNEGAAFPYEPGCLSAHRDDMPCKCADEYALILLYPWMD